MNKDSSTGMNYKHCIFDFDCTLTRYHWWKGIYNGHFYKSINRILININDTKDTNNIRRFLTNIRNKHSNNDINEYNAYTDDNFKNMQSFVEFVFGGKEVVNNLRRSLENLRNNCVQLHISTNGQANEVIELLELVGISKNMFSYIHGYSDFRDEKIVIDILNTDNIITDNFTDNIITDNFNGEKLTNLKLPFIRAICKDSIKDNCIYIDDDGREYRKCKDLCTCINLAYENGGMREEHFNEIKKILKLL